MLTDTLIATVLGLPLSVRLALLDADPTGLGWLCFTTGDGSGFDPHLRQLGVSARKDQDTRNSVEHGIAWLPSNPLTVLSVASDLYSQTARGRDCWPHAARAIGRKWVLYLMATDANGESRAVVSAENVDPLAAAVEVLREVCRG